jgi:putative hemolysin
MELRQLTNTKLEKAGVTLDIDDFDRKEFAKTKGAVFVCNQLLPGLDEWILTHLLAEYFETVRLLHPYHTPPPRDLKPIVITPKGLKITEGLINIRFAKRLTRLVGKGAAVGLSIDFSENPLSHLGKNILRTRVIQQLRKARQPIIPIHLTTEHLPGGLLRRAIPGLPFSYTSQPVRIQVRVGNVITPEDIGAFKKGNQWAKFLQAKIFSLGSRFEIQPEHFTQPKPEGMQPIAEALAPELMTAEMAALPPECKIASRGQFDVYIAPFQALPNVMFEIARLREITFRAAGEGTGKPRDIDEHDMYYLQLIIWDRDQQKIAGGYRLGQGDLIFKQFGVNGFYTNSLFKIKPGFFPILEQAVELGRSYVTQDYQKHRLPLFLMWKGILCFLLANPQYRYLYGPVSISKDYSDASKSIIVEFVRRFFYDEELAKLVAPRKPFQAHIKSVDTKILAEALHGEFEALESLIETIEPAHFKVPVLFRQYLKQNAKFIAFNVDPNFADCLDGLMILDIKHLPASTIEALQQEK